MKMTLTRSAEKASGGKKANRNEAAEPGAPATPAPQPVGKKKSSPRKTRPSKSTRAAAELSTLLVIGGEPRVDLLPPEVRTQRKAKSTRRVLGFAVLGTVLLMLLATGGASLYAVQSQAELTSAQAQTGLLLAQQAKYVKVANVQKQVQLVQTAQKVGSSTEIDWQAYLDNVQAVLPANVTIQDVDVESASTVALFSQPTAALQTARVATVTFTADSPVVPLIPAWLDGLATLKGFAGAVPTSTQLNPTTNHYTVVITMNVNSAAFDNRFTSKEK